METTERSINRNSETVSLSAIWLRRIGDKVQVLAESKGKHGRHFFLVIEEQADGAFSHIVEVEGILNSPIDPLTEKESGL